MENKLVKTNNNGAYIMAVLIPLVGFIIGVIQLGTGNKYGIKTILVSCVSMALSMMIIFGFIAGAMQV